jgi:hypothetical protein
MEHELNDDDDPVGYKRPPRKHQFPKGKSDNPNGRPRKARPDTSNETLAETLKRIGEEKVEIKGQTMTLNELGIRSLMHKVAAGNVQAAKHLQSLRKEAGANEARGGGGVLVVPGTVPLHEWSVAAARQQAKFRGEDPEGLARLEEKNLGKKLPREGEA